MRNFLRLLPKKVAKMQSAYGPKVKEAYELANEVHKGQKRKTGDNYIVHPIEVATILFNIGADEDVVCAALLHDTLEESEHPDEMRDRIYRDFGDQVLYLVDAVSKDTEITDKLAQQAAYLEQINQAFKLDIFVFFIKVADLLDNIQTIDALPKERATQWIKELKYQYWPLLSGYLHQIPLAHREMYQQLLQEVESTIQKFETSPAQQAESTIPN